MISFKKYTLLNEAFQLPYNVIQPILDYYYESYKTFLKAGREKVTPKLFPEKNFKLDFSGTNFEFLNEMNPNVNVYFLHNRNLDSTAYFWVYDRNKVDTFDKTNTGNIYINLIARFETMYYGTIEHEVLHYIQYLIGKYKKLKKRQDEYGGLPSKKLIPSGMTTRGKVKEKRTHHEYRPIEYYTNLMSAIRSMELAYEREMLKEPLTYAKDIKNKEMRKSFLGYVLKAVRENRSGTSEYFKLLSKMKKFSPEIYKKYLQIIYKVFVEGEPAHNLSDIKKLVADLVEARAEGEEFKRGKREKELTKSIIWRSRSSREASSLKFISYDTSNVFGTYNNIYDGATISGEELLLDLGATEKEEDDDVYFVLPRGKSNVVKLFQNLKKLKERKVDYELRVGTTDNLRDPNGEEIVKIYNAVFEELKERYLESAEDQSKSHLSSLIDAAYL